MNAIIEATAQAAPIVLHEIPAFDPMLSMIEKAVSSGQDPKVISEMMALMERAEARRARQAFDAAVSAAKGEIRPILKDKEVSYPSKSVDAKSVGAKNNTAYRHESLAGIAKVIDPVLNANGLSYRFRAAQANGRLTVTCVLSHRDGHSEETTLEAPNDQSGSKNAIQAIGSAATYLQRYTLKLALGLSTTDKDDDGRAAYGNGDTITDQQRDQLQEKIDATGADIAAFCKHIGVAALCDMTRDQFPRAMAALERKAAALSALQRAGDSGSGVPVEANHAQ